MTGPESAITQHFQQRLKSLSLYPASMAVIIGFSVLIGWQFNIEFLKRTIPGLVAMNPATAICFMLSGMALILISGEQQLKSAAYVWRTFAILTALIGLSCLLTNIVGINGGIDHILFAHKLTDEVDNIPNRMAPNTGFNFMLTGMSILLYGYNKHKLSQYIILTNALVALLSVIGYIYGVRAFYGVLTYIPMAINTAFCFLLVSTAALLAWCDKGLMEGFTANYVGSVLARRLLPPIIIVPVLLGFLIIYAEKAGLYVPHFGTALFTAANILIFILLVKKIQDSVNKADIARKEAENKLMEMNVKLEESAESLKILNSELESFSYSISHDLKAPLRAISGYAGMLREDYHKQLDEEGNRRLNLIGDNSERMKQLIEDLLDFSHFRRKEMQEAHCDMLLLVKSVLKEEYLAIKKKEYEIKIGELFDCPGDAKMIECVWVNLISNALKYSEKKDKPVIEIGSYKEGNRYVYFVKDNGAGFDMSYSNKLFGVFQRLHSPGDFDGTGIGLAIVHKIITRHGGNVWAEAKVGEGANFYFSLPITPRHPSVIK